MKKPKFEILFLGTIDRVYTIYSNQFVKNEAHVEALILEMYTKQKSEYSRYNFALGLGPEDWLYDRAKKFLETKLPLENEPLFYGKRQDLVFAPKQLVKRVQKSLFRKNLRIGKHIKYIFDLLWKMLVKNKKYLYMFFIGFCLSLALYFVVFFVFYTPSEEVKDLPVEDEVFSKEIRKILEDSWESKIVEISNEEDSVNEKDQVIHGVNFYTQELDIE